MRKIYLFLSLLSLSVFAQAKTYDQSKSQQRADASKHEVIEVIKHCVQNPEALSDEEYQLCQKLLNNLSHNEEVRELRKIFLAGNIYSPGA